MFKVALVGAISDVPGLGLESDHGQTHRSLHEIVVHKRHDKCLGRVAVIEVQVAGWWMYNSRSARPCRGAVATVVQVTETEPEVPLVRTTVM